MAETQYSESSNGPEGEYSGEEIFFGGSAFKELDKNSRRDIAADEVHFACNLCNQWHSTLSSLLIHFLDHFGDCPSCDSCGETFTDARDYADHCITHIGHTCIVCDKVFYSESEYVAHLLEHKLQCIYCMTRFSTEEDLKNHYNSEHDELKFQCDICCRYYTTLGKLNAHVRLNHIANSQTYRCEECNITFSRKPNLDHHISRQHKNEKPYVCELCNRGFSYKRSLKTHMFHHSGEKPYTCLVCTRSFAGYRNFHKHGLMHLTDQIYECDICFETFTSKPKYDYHMNTHLNEGRYKCEVCHHAYKFSSHLKRHILTHKNEKPYACEVCEKRYYDKSYLMKHLRIAHKYNEKEINDIVQLMNQERLFKKAAESELPY